MSNPENKEIPSAEGYNVGSIAELELHFPSVKKIIVQIVDVKKDLFGGKLRIYAQEVGKVGEGKRVHVGYPEHFKIIKEAAVA